MESGGRVEGKGKKYFERVCDSHFNLQAYRPTEWRSGLLVWLSRPPTMNNKASSPKAEGPSKFTLKQHSSLAFKGKYLPDFVQSRPDFDLVCDDDMCIFKKSFCITASENNTKTVLACMRVRGVSGSFMGYDHEAFIWADPRQSTERQSELISTLLEECQKHKSMIVYVGKEDTMMRSMLGRMGFDIDAHFLNESLNDPYVGFGDKYVEF